MQNGGFQCEVNNQYPSQPPSYPAQPGYGQPYPSQPGYAGQPQPGCAYPSSAPYNTNGPTPQHQQQQTIIVGGQPTVAYVAQPIVSTVGAIVLSCFVFWCCGAVLGLIAFILAMIGHSSASAGDSVGAMRFRNASYGVSIAGIVVGIIAIIVIGAILGTNASKIYNSYCYYSSGYKYCNYY